MSQTLLPRIDGGRTAAFEIMVTTPAVRNIIREGKTSELPNVMRLSAKDGMNTLDQALTDLVGRGVVSQEEAMMKASNPDQLKKSLDFQHAGLRPAALVGEVEQVM